jgi:hypothetical protein
VRPRVAGWGQLRGKPYSDGVGGCSERGADPWGAIEIQSNFFSHAASDSFFFAECTGVTSPRLCADS